MYGDTSPTLPSVPGVPVQAVPQNDVGLEGQLRSRLNCSLQVFEHHGSLVVTPEFAKKPRWGLFVSENAGVKPEMNTMNDSSQEMLL